MKTFQKSNLIKIAALLFVTMPGLVFMIVLILGFDATYYELGRNPIFGFDQPTPDPRNAAGAMLLYIAAVFFFLVISAVLMLTMKNSKGEMIINSKKVIGLKLLAVGVLCTILMACSIIIPFSSYTFEFAQNLRRGNFNPNVAVFLQADILSTQARNVIIENDDIIINYTIPPAPPPAPPGPPTHGQTSISAAEFTGILLSFINVPLDEWETRVAAIVSQRANAEADARNLDHPAQRAPFVAQFSGPFNGRLNGMLNGRYVDAEDEDGNYVYIEDDAGNPVRKQEFRTGVRHGIEGAIVSATESAIAYADYRFLHTMVWSIVNMSIIGMMPLVIGGLIFAQRKKQDDIEVGSAEL